MKYVKIFALALGLASLTACSDSDDYNSASGVTVEMGKSEIQVKENKGKFFVPVTLTGDANGPVKVNLKIEASGPNPALPFEDRNGSWDGDYIVTSETLNIPEGVSSVNVEINTVDNREENEDKTFIITIASAEGAAIGSQSSTTVIIKDNDSLPYEKIQGEWTLSGFSIYEKEDVKLTCRIDGYEEGEPGFDSKLLLKDIFKADSNEEGTELAMAFIYDEATGEAYVDIDLPQMMGQFRTTSNYIWGFAGIVEDGQLASIGGGTIRGTVSADYNTITFEPDATFVGFVASANLAVQLGVYDAFTNLKLVR